MPIDTTALILDYSGEPIKTGRIPDGTPNGKPDPNSPDLTVRDAVFEALNQFKQGEEPTNEESLKKYRITGLFFAAPVLDDLTKEDAAYIRDRSGKVLAPLTHGRLCDVLDNAAQIVKAQSNGRGDGTWKAGEPTPAELESV